MRKLALLVILLLVVSLIAGVVGCGGEKKVTPTPTPLPTATPALTPTPTPTATASPGTTPDAAAMMERASLAVAATTSYRLYMTTSISAVTKIEGKSDEIRLSFVGDVALDVSGRKMEMKNLWNWKLPPDQPAPPVMENTIYIVDDVMYIKGYFADEPEQWGKTSVPETYWQIMNQAKLNVELLKVSGVTVLPPETIRSRDLDIPSNVLQVTPTQEKFWELIAQQPGVNLPPQLPPGVTFDQIVKSGDLRLWLAQTTDLPLKVEMKMDMQIDPTIIAEAPGEQSIYIEITLQFYDYNQPVSIELPAEANDAIELTQEPPVEQTT